MQEITTTALIRYGETTRRQGTAVRYSKRILLNQYDYNVKTLYCIKVQLDITVCMEV